jgi:nucleoside-diphosphate-sugar epimerase
MARILLTGATGYLGSHLAHAYTDSGHEVAVFKRSTSQMDRIATIANKLKVFDLDSDGVLAPFEALGHIDAVVHTATCYGRNNESPLEVFKANTQFPLELLEAAVFFKSDSFFNTDTILSEDVNAYALSKKQFSQWGKSYAETGKIRFVNIRLEHIFGPGDDPSKFTTWVIRQCLANVPVIPLTRGEQKRDFIYINDVVSAYLLLLEKVADESKWLEIGLGSGQPVTIKELVEEIHTITHSSSKLDFGALPYRMNEVMASAAEMSFMQTAGWKTEWDLRSGLRETVNRELNK